MVVPQMYFLGFVDLSVRSVDAKSGWNMNRATYGTTHAWETTTVPPEFHVFNLKNGKHGQAVQCSVPGTMLWFNPGRQLSPTWLLARSPLVGWGRQSEG